MDENNTSLPPESKKPSLKKIIIVFLILFFLIDAGLFVKWSNMNHAGSEEAGNVDNTPEIKTKICDRDRINATTEDPSGLESELLPVVNDNTYDQFSRENLIDLYVKYLGCRIMTQEDNAGIYELGDSFLSQIDQTFYINSPENYERNMLTRKAYFTTLKLGRYTLDGEYKSYLDNKNFGDLLVDFNYKLSEMCPYLTEKCEESQLPVQLGIAGNFCEELCVKAAEYDNDPEKFHDEIIVNNFKNWTDGDKIASWPFIRIVLAYRYGQESMANEICDYVDSSETIKCQNLVRGTINAINIYSRDVTPCDTVPGRIVDIYCNLYESS